jgi:hypothetical protein
MPPPLHISIAAAWYYTFILLPLAHYGHEKPRLHAQRERVQLALGDPKQCLTNSRLTQDELYELAELLGIDTDEQLAGNWRFSRLERLLIALHSLSGQQATRRAQLQWGWAAHSISLNLQQMVTLIIDRLDAPDSRTCALVTARVCCPFAVLLLIIAFDVLLAPVSQPTLSAAGRLMSSRRGWMIQSALQSSTTASAWWMRRT